MCFRAFLLNGMRVFSLVMLLMYSGLSAAAVDDKACVSCHESVRNMITNGSGHPAMAMGCGTCHVDHTLPNPGKGNPHYLTADPGVLCATCHAEVGTKEFVHEPVKKDCTLCHNPHLGLKDGLRAQGNALCLECHLDASKSKFETDSPVKLFNGQVTLPPRYFKNLQLLALSNDRGHPVSNHPVLRGQDADWPAVTCIVCHKPHGADKSASLLVHESDDTYSLCLRCHK
jgi:predicted CXXCH cytochrome family protein